MFYKTWAYVQRRKPSPYFFDYIYNFITGTILCLILTLLALLIPDLRAPDVIKGFLFVSLALYFVVLIWSCFGNCTGWAYLLDKRKREIKIVCGQIWDISYEQIDSVMLYGAFGPDPNKVYLFFSDDLKALRAELYYRQEDQNIYPRGRFGKNERALETKDGTKLKLIRLVMTTPKWELIGKFLELCPSSEIEMVTWKRSRILIEFRPVEGMEYPPEALECLEQINAMYP